MRRADRLFQLLLLLRGRRRTTAKQLADWLEVSERTVYRDVSDRVASGVPLDGEAGVGYRLKSGFDVPPLMFTRDEIEALVLGTRVVRAWGGPQLGRAADHALAKIEAVLPDGRRGTARRARLFAVDYFIPPEAGANLDVLRGAIEERRRVRFDYTRADGAASSRDALPLGLFYWGRTWTLGAWCELRDGYRSFRVDRMRAIEVRDERFAESEAVSLAGYLRQYGAEDALDSES